MNVTAIVAKPTSSSIDDPRQKQIDIAWIGQRVTADGHLIQFDPMSPEILGRQLVDAYWQHDANIEHWWDMFITGEHIIDPPTNDSGDAEWVYIGASRSFIVLRHQEDGWSVGQCLWSDDPATIQYQLIV